MPDGDELTDPGEDHVEEEDEEQEDDLEKGEEDEGEDNQQGVQEEEDRDQVSSLTDSTSRNFAYWTKVRSTPGPYPLRVLASMWPRQSRT